MSPRTGRPTEAPKRDRTAVRMDEETVRILNAYCEQENVSHSEAIRRGVKRLEPDLKK